MGSHWVGVCVHTQSLNELVQEESIDQEEKRASTGLQGKLGIRDMRRSWGEKYVNRILVSGNFQEQALSEWDHGSVSKGNLNKGEKRSSLMSTKQCEQGWGTGPRTTQVTYHDPVERSVSTGGV